MKPEKKPYYTMMTEPAVDALWFTASGFGPNAFTLKLRGFPAEEHSPTPALGISFHASKEGLIIGDTVGAMLGGGLYFHREQVAELHRQFGMWLEENKSVHDPRFLNGPAGARTLIGCGCGWRVTVHEGDAEGQLARHVASTLAAGQ